MVDQVLENNLPSQALEDQVKGLAFLSLTQIRVLDGDGNVIADLGGPEPNRVVSLSSSVSGENGVKHWDWKCDHGSREQQWDRQHSWRPNPYP